MEKMAIRTVFLKKQVQEKVYTFDELAEDVQARLVSEYADEVKTDYQNFGFDSAYLCEMVEDDLHAFGFNPTDWWYQCAYCQGDGAAFSGEFEDSDDALKAAEIYAFFTPEEHAAILNYMEGVKINMRGNCPYMEVDYSFDPPHYLKFQDVYDSAEEKIQKALKQWAEERAANLYDNLIEEMEYQSSEENAREYLMYDADRYYFADGTEVDEKDIVA